MHWTETCCDRQRRFADHAITETFRSASSRLYTNRSLLRYSKTATDVLDPPFPDLPEILRACQQRFSLMGRSRQIRSPTASRKQQRGTSKPVNTTGPNSKISSLRLRQEHKRPSIFVNQNAYRFLGVRSPRFISSPYTVCSKLKRSASCC